MSNVRILAKPHPAQKIVHDDPTRFRVLAAGRRFGKTRLGVNESIEVAAAGGRSWWVAPTYKMSEVGWRPLKRIVSRIPGAEVKNGDRMVMLPGGGEVWIRSADNPDTLRGEGLNFVVLDECAFQKPEVWKEALRPALSDTLGRALFISTPRGRNWFWDLYLYGQAGEEGWASYCFPTASNPYIPASEIEAARRDLPEIIFQQEYLAEFIDDAGGVFRRVHDAAVLDALDEPQEGRIYSAGVDVAASIDYTVITVLDVASREMVYMDRFNRVDYPVLEDRLIALHKRWKLNGMVVEANGIGRPVIDHMTEKGLLVTPFMTTNASKQTIIQGLQSAFEHGSIRVLNDAHLVGELLSFESKRGISGNFSYSAPDGMHDDCVMSLALALYGISGANWLVS